MAAVGKVVIDLEVGKNLETTFRLIARDEISKAAARRHPRIRALLQRIRVL